MPKKIPSNPALDALIEKAAQAISKDPSKAAILLTDWISRPAKSTPSQTRPQPIIRKKAG